MYYTKIERTIDPEFLASDKVVAFTSTVVATGITADAEGRKIVRKGSLIAESGKVVKITASGDTVTFSEPPAGILMDSLDVTYSSQPASLLIEGYVIGQRLQLGVDYTDVIGKKIHEVLTEIKFVKREEE